MRAMLALTLVLGCLIMGSLAMTFVISSSSTVGTILFFILVFLPTAYAVWVSASLITWGDR